MDDSDRGHSDEENEDVARLVAMLKRLQTDNVELRRNFESLKELHMQLNGDHKQLHAKYNALHEERVTVERQYQALCESWRVELEEKQRQFEQVKAQILGPRDLELLKLQMLEKAEAPFRAKCDLLAREAEASQQKFVRQRREFEELQAAHRALELHTQHDRENLVADYTATITDLKDKLAAATQQQGKMLQAEARVKALEREKQELTWQLTKIKEEMEELRQAKEKAAVEKGSAELRVERKVQSIQAEELQLSGLVESLTRKNRHLQKELAEAHKASEEMFEQRLRLQSAQASLQSQLDSERRAHASAVAAQEEQHLLAARALEDKLLLLRDELHEKERQKAELHISHQEQVTQLLNGHSLQLEDLQKEHAAKIRELKEQQAEVAAKAAALKDQLDESRRETDDATYKAKRDADSAARQVERLQTQLTETQHTLAQREAELSDLKVEVDRLKSEVLRLELSVRQSEQRRDDLQEQLSRQQEQLHEVDEARKQLSLAREELQRDLEQQRAIHMEQFDQQRQSFAMEKSALTRRYQATLKELGARHDLDVKKLRKRAKAAEQQAQQMGAELADLRLRSELDMMAGMQPPDTALARDAAAGLFLTKPWALAGAGTAGYHPGPGTAGAAGFAQGTLSRPGGAGTAVPHLTASGQGAEGLDGAAGRATGALGTGAGERLQDQNLVSGMAALWQRQEDYLAAAGRG